LFCQKEWLLALDRFNIAGEIVHPHVAQILIGINLVEDRAPDRHLAGAVRGWAFLALNDLANAGAGKLAAGTHRDLREVGHVDAQSRSGRAVSFAVDAVTAGAVVAKDGSAVQRVNLRIFLRLRRGAWREAEERHCHNSYAGC